MTQHTTEGAAPQIRLHCGRSAARVRNKCGTSAAQLRHKCGTSAAQVRHKCGTSTLHRAPVGQGPSGPDDDWLAIAFGFWSGRALATGTAWAGLCLIYHHQHKCGTSAAQVRHKCGTSAEQVRRTVRIACSGTPADVRRGVFWQKHPPKNTKTPRKAQKHQKRRKIPIFFAFRAVCRYPCGFAAERRRHRCGTGADRVRNAGGPPADRRRTAGGPPADRRRTAGGTQAERRRICGAASSDTQPK